MRILTHTQTEYLGQEMPILRTVSLLVDLSATSSYENSVIRSRDSRSLKTQF